MCVTEVKPWSNEGMNSPLKVLKTKKTEKTFDSALRSKKLDLTLELTSTSNLKALSK